MSDAMWKVEQAFLSRTEIMLVQRSFNKSSLRPATVRVKELGRYGKSGARLLLCELKSGMPFVLKIHEKKKIRQESQAIKSVTNYFRDVSLPAAPTYCDGKGALLYWHQGADTGQQVGESKEFRDIVYQYDRGSHAFQYSNERVIKLLGQVWSRCRNARSQVRKGNLIFKDEYAWYTRRETASEAISCMLGSQSSKEEFRFLGANICNPLFVIAQRFFETQRRGKKGPVHGDLHANNLIVDSSDNVHLIDFAWAVNQRHVLVDYVLMECSLRFLLFPHHVDPSEQLAVDEILLKSDGGQRLAKWDRESPLANYYRRLGVIIDEIRTQASEFLVGSDERGFLEYLASQFMILFGQMSYRDYNRLLAARALGLIGRELLDQNFGSS